MTTNNFPEWLNSQLAERDLRPADLSRSGNINKGVLSRILSGERKPANETLESIARALHIPPEDVFRAAGILPPSKSGDPWVNAQSYKLEQITDPTLRSIAENFLETMVKQEEAGQQAKLKPHSATR